MKRFLPIFFLVCITSSAFALDVTFGGVKFRSSYATTSGTINQFSDSTTLSFDTATFKGLLFIKGKVSIDPLQYPYFQVGLGTGYKIYAKIGNSNTYQLLDSSNNTSAWTNLDVRGFFDPVNGFPLQATAGPTISIASIQFRPVKVFFENKPPSSGANQSIIGLQGQFLMPVDSGSSLALFNSGTQKLYITDTGNYAPGFVTSSSSNTLFGLNKMVFRNNGGLTVSYNATGKVFALYGSITGFIPDDSIAYPGDSMNIKIGNSAAPGLIVSGGTFTAMTGAVFDNFKMKALNIDPDTLNIGYNTSTNRYEAYGNITHLLEIDSIPGSLGNALNPGLIINNGKLSSFTSTVIKNINLKKQKIDPDTFTFSYDAGKRQYSLYGGLTLIIGKDSMHANLGFANAPGLIVKNGKLNSFSASITQNIKIKNLRINPDTLTFRYSPDNNQFTMFGGLTLMYAADSLYANLGNANNPGMISSNDTIRSFNAFIAGNIKIKKLLIDPDTLVFSYNQSTDNFKSYGKLNFIVGADTIGANLGDTLNPGMVVKNDTLQLFNAAITGNFKIDSLAIDPDTLMLSYQSATDIFSAYGGIKFLIKKDTIYAGLGTVSNPGLIIKNDTFQLLQASITANFKIDSMAIDPDTLTFSYNNVSDQFLTYGAMKLLLRKDTIYAALGNATNPGMSVNSGSISSFAASITANFKIDSLTLDPDTLTLTYQRDSSEFDIYGNLKMILEGDTILAALGNVLSPGAVIKGGKLNQFNTAITGNFKLKKTMFDPDTLTFAYNSINENFGCYGNLKVLTENDTIAAYLGTVSNPGFLVNNGKLVSLNAGVTANFRIDSLTIDPDTLTFTYNTDSSQYTMSGGVKLIMEGDTLNGKLGDSFNKGMVISNGQLTAFYTSFTGNVKIKKLMLDPDTLVISYDRPSDQFLSYGNLKILSTRDTIQAQLGNEQNPGMTINSGQLSTFSCGITTSFKIDSLTFDPDTLTFSYNRTQDNYSAYGNLKMLLESDTILATLGNVTSPGMAFINGNLNQFNISTTGNISLKKVTFDPDTLTIAYNKDSLLFKAYGNMKVLTAKDTIVSVWGNATSPGLVINNGMLTSLNGSITSNFSIDSTLFDPKDTLTLFYARSNNTFGIYGGVQIFTEHDTITLNLGNQTNPGLAIGNRAIQNINADITNKFTIKKMLFAPDSLTLVYNKDSALFSIFGAVKVLTSKDTIYTRLGNASNPGLLIQKGQLLYLNAGITANFKIDSLQFDPDTLTLTYNRTADQYGMYGGFKVYYDADTIAASLGNQNTPGLWFSNGLIQQFNAGVSGKFRVRKLEVLPNSLTFTYNRDSALYAMYGTVSALVPKDSVSKDTMSLYLGNQATPGFLIKQGKLQQLNAAITTRFTLKGANFRPYSFGVSLNIPKSQYEFYGSLNVLMAKDSLHKDSFNIGLGNQASPGMIIRNGSLNSVNASVTAAFKVKGLSVTPQNLTFIYDSASAQFKMYGGLTLAYSNEYMNVKMGQQKPDSSWIPGLAINTKTGALESLFFSTTDTFRIKKLLIAPTNLTLIYDKDSDYFEMYGAALVKLDSNKIAINMGNAQTPGLVIDSGQIENINFGITADFKIGGFELKPTDLTFQYDKPKDQWEMYGDVSFILDKDTITALLGNAASPGLLVQNGILTQLNIAVNSDIKIAKLDVKTDSLGVKYVRTNLPGGHYTETFYMYGGVSFSELWSASVTLNTPQNPYGLEIAIDSFGNKTLIVNGITAELDQASIGGITIKQLKATINRLGSGDYDIDAICQVSFPAGFEIDGELEFIDNNGSFQLVKISVDYTALGDNQGIELVGGIAITELGGSLAYTDIPASCVSKVVTYDSIQRMASWPYSYVNYGIVSRTVSTCTPETQNFQLTAKVALDVGGQLGLLGKEVQMVRSVGNVTLTKDYLDINDTVVLGAYNAGSGWQGVVTAGFADVNLNWTTGIYMVTGDMKYPPAASLVDIKAGFLYKTTGLIDAELNLGLILPTWIPIVGGDQYASVNGIFRYAKTDPNNSYAGGWVTYSYPSICSSGPHWWDDYPCLQSGEIGAGYFFGNGSTRVLYSGDVTNLQNTVTNDGLKKAGTSFNNIIASSKFNLDGSSSSALIKIIPSEKLDIFEKRNDSIIERVQVAIIGPLGTQTQLSFYYRKDDQSQPDIVDNLMALDSIYKDSTPFITTIISSNGNRAGEALPSGEYTVLLTLDSGMVSKDFNFTSQVNQFYPKPGATVLVKNASNIIKQGENLELEIGSLLNVTNDTLQPKVFVYYDEDTTGYDGHLFGTYPVNANENTLVSLAPHVDSVVVKYDTIIVNGQKAINKIKKPMFMPNKTIYTYCKLEDGINRPVKSSYTSAINFVFQPNTKLLIGGGKPYELNSTSDSLYIKINTDFGNNTLSNYWITVYYDFDSNARTGVPIKNMSHINASQLNSNGYWFKPPFNKLKSVERVFFYAIVTDSTTGYMYKSYNSAPYLYGNNLHIKYVYGDKNQTPAAGIKVAIDKNGNNKLDGHEYAHKTNRNGVFELSVDAPEVDIVTKVSKPLEGYTDSSVLNQIHTISATTTNIVKITINHPSIKGKVTDTLERSKTGIRVYADLNKNGTFDQGVDISTLTDKNGEYALLNVFGDDILVKADLENTSYNQFVASIQPLNFKPNKFHNINLKLK